MLAPSEPGGAQGTRPGAEEAGGLPHARGFRTGDPAEARARTKEFLGCTHQMTVLDREPPFLADVQFRELCGLGLLFSGYGAAVEIDCTPPVDKVTVNFVKGGRMRIEDGGLVTFADPRHPAVFSFHDELAMRWTPGMRQLMVAVDRPRVERFLRNLIAQPLHDPLDFDSRVDLVDGGQAIASAVTTLRLALRRCGKAGPPPVLAAELEHCLLTALLLGQRHNYTDEIFSAQALPSPRVVRRVIELVDEEPGTPFTIADLAGYAGVSERSLHAAFRRQLGVSPMSYVRRRRLDQAHEELLSLDRGAGAKVTDVALRYGFAHTSRFAAAYRKRFGELPSATLRR
jgi:AraC-like DNA-binding protein